MKRDLTNLNCGFLGKANDYIFSQVFPIFKIARKEKRKL
jgi:hypothetical protein